jgi:CheY-like chemotaxis protein
MVEHTAKRALERARTDLPDVCLLDIGLPDLDGNDLARQLRAQPETAQSIMIAITGYGQEQDRKRTAESGFDHHLVKPVNMEQLLRLLSEVL